MNCPAADGFKLYKPIEKSFIRGKNLDVILLKLMQWPKVNIHTYIEKSTDLCFWHISNNAGSIKLYKPSDNYSSKSSKTNAMVKIHMYTERSTAPFFLGGWGVPYFE